MHKYIHINLPPASQGQRASMNISCTASCTELSTAAHHAEDDLPSALVKQRSESNSKALALPVVPAALSEEPYCTPTKPAQRRKRSTCWCARACSEGAGQ